MSLLLRRDPTSAWPSSRRRCLLQVYRSRGPMQISLGKNTGCPAAPAPITAPASVGLWASRSWTRSPDRFGLPRGSLSFGAAVRLGLLPHTASRRQGRRLTTAYPCVQLPLARGCYQLAPQRTFTSNPVPMPGTPTGPSAVKSTFNSLLLDILAAPFSPTIPCPRKSGAAHRFRAAAALSWAKAVPIQVARIRRWVLPA